MDEEDNMEDVFAELDDDELAQIAEGNFASIL